MSIDVLPRGVMYIFMIVKCFVVFMCTSTVVVLCYVDLWAWYVCDVVSDECLLGIW